MKRTAAILGFLFLGVMIASALPADITYVEGDASVRTKAGTLADAQIGDVLQTGDTLKTGHDGQATLDQRGVTINVAGSTVFTLMEHAQGGAITPVLSVALGSIKYKFNKIGGGAEPQIRTNGAIAGVRGTEFSVFAGADGSTLFAVDSGQITVESEGKSVDLAANEGVEVPLGKPPGDKITVHSDQIDYSKWNEDKLAAMVADPLTAMDNIDASLASYSMNVTDYAARFADSSKTLADDRGQRNSILSEKGKDAAATYQDQVITPLALNTGYLFLNTRYYALAALSMRRFVAGRLYVTLKAQFINDPQNAAWVSFLDRYSAFLRSFEELIIPQLVAADI